MDEIAKKTYLSGLLKGIAGFSIDSNGPANTELTAYADGVMGKTAFGVAALLAPPYGTLLGTYLLVDAGIQTAKKLQHKPMGGLVGLLYGRMKNEKE